MEISNAKTQTTHGKVLMLTESAIMLALATVLSMIKVIDMPYGGSITAFSMVPIIIIAYRYGVKWGLLTGFVYSLIQMLLGASNLSYATSAIALIAIIMLDYVLAFSLLGLSGIFKNKFNNPVVEATVGATMVCIIRYICHVISGCTVWAGVSIPTSDGLVYSLGYNAAYMVPETIITIAVTFWLFQSFSFTGKQIIRIDSEKTNTLTAVFSSLSVLSIMGAVIFDAINLFMTIQNEEGYNITLISNANFPLIGLVFGAGLVLCIVFALISKKCKSKN